MKTHIPEYMLSAFSAQGIDTGRLIYAIHTDMALDGSHADTYAALDMENLYVLYGLEKVVKVTGTRRIVSAYEVHHMDTFRLLDLGELKYERLLSTGRLFSEKDGEAKILLLFSVGYLAYAERLIKAVKNIREGTDPLSEILTDEELFCPKCGTRYPEPERKLCPKCMDKKSITVRLLGFFKDYKAKVTTILLVMLAGTAFSTLTPDVSNKLFLRSEERRVG